MSNNALRTICMAALAVGMLCHGAPTVAQDTFTSKPENLGKNVNSAYDEVLPIISPDGKTLYFDRKDHPENVGNDDIWMSTLQRDGSWSAATNMGEPFNNGYANFVCSVTPDGNTLLLGNVYNGDGTMSPGASITNRTRTGWSTPQALKIRQFYNVNRFSGYALANDGKTLLLSIQRRDSYGDLDIYVSFIQQNGEWSEPMNIGPDVNTSRGDFTPFLAADGVSLYFSSEGQGGIGDADIFVTRRLDNTWKNWSKPQNLGRPVNTEGWDAYFTIPAKGDYAYFVSAHNSYGANDIYRIKLPSPLKPKPVVLISGRVLDKKTRQPVEARIVYETLPDGKEIGVARSNPENGAYQIALPAGANYGFRAVSEGFVAISDNLNLAKVNEYREITRDLLLVPIEVGETVRLTNLFFDFAKADLQQESFPELDRVVTFLNENGRITIEIGGHTDNVGATADNRSLSEQRARAVADYLISHGIDRGRISVKGYGESKPIASNGTEEGRQQNRRVEFRIKKK